MLLSKSILAGALALFGIASSQVVVTLTSTITVITVTVTPESTSTSTVVVTVSGAPPPPGSSTSTKTVTVTATEACPIPTFGTCGGTNYKGTCRGKCASGLNCAYYSEYYSQCLRPGQKPKPVTTSAVKTITVYHQ